MKVWSGGCVFTVECFNGRMNRSRTGEIDNSEQIGVESELLNIA